MGNDLKEILVTAEDMDRRLGEMAEQIDRDYAGKELLIVGVLRGAVMVMADLSRKLHTPLEMDWMAVSSYGSGTKSSGVVRILKDLDQDVAGRHVLIVEDIIDSGLTLSWLQANLMGRGAASVNIATALRKPAAAKVDLRGLRYSRRVRRRLRPRLRGKIPQPTLRGDAPTPRLRQLTTSEPDKGHT